MPQVPSAVQTVPPTILENGTKKKWSTQLARVSVKGLCPEDQYDLTRVLSQTDRLRGHLTELLQCVRTLPAGKLRRRLEGHTAVWRNQTKHHLEYFIQRFVFPFKELDVEGCQYLVFLEDFADPSVVNRTFTVCSESSRYGDLDGVRMRLLKGVETADRDISLCSRILAAAHDPSMTHPLRCQGLKEVVSTAETLTELLDGLDYLVGVSDAELHGNKIAKDRRQADALASRVLPLKDWVHLKHLLRPATTI